MNMRKAFFLLSAFLFFSCSGQKVKDVSEETSLSLKNQITERAESIYWTKSGEEDLLKNNIRKNENFKNGTQVNQEGLKALTVSDKVFPKISDFASLDVSMLSKEELLIINTFCTNLLSLDYEKALESFYADNLWAMVLLKYDIEEAGFSGFKNYVLGEGYWHENFCELPVRFYSDKKQSFDVKLVFNQEKMLVFEVSHS